MTVWLISNGRAVPPDEREADQYWRLVMGQIWEHHRQGLPDYAASFQPHDHEPVMLLVLLE